MRGRLAAAAAAIVAGADWIIHHRTPRWIRIAVFDLPAHLATAGLVALNLPGRSSRWHTGFMAGALLPDIDHVPLALAENHPEPSSPRPGTHSLATVAPLFVLARASNSELLEGAAWGTLAHFARDVSTGPGMPLLRPFRSHSVRVPYPVYAGAMAALAALALTREQRARYCG